MSDREDEDRQRELLRELRPSKRPSLVIIDIDHPDLPEPRRVVLRPDPELGTSAEAEAQEPKP